MVSDFIILVLPFHRIWTLQMPWKRKSKILAVFTIGFLACVSSIVRLVYSVQLSQIPNTEAASQAQQLATDKDGLWGFAEIALGIIAGCMPIIPRFFKQPLFASLSSGSWLGSNVRQSSRNSSRTLGSPRLFGKPSSGRTLSTLFSSQQSYGTKTSGGKSFHDIETQNTRASLVISGITFPQPPLQVYRGADSQWPLVNKSIWSNNDRDMEWQKMSTLEKGKPSIETKRGQLER